MNRSRKPHIVSVFGSSRPREGEGEYETAYTVGRSLASAGFTVCNGGYGGTMEASARGARDAGGKTIGVVTEYFSRRANPSINRTIVTKSLLGRLTKLMELGEAYVVLRGGTGTLLELAAVWEYMNKQLMRPKPILVVGRFWSPVIGLVRDELVKEGRTNAAGLVTLVKRPELCGEILSHMLETA